MVGKALYREWESKSSKILTVYESRWKSQRCLFFSSGNLDIFCFLCGYSVYIFCLYQGKFWCYIFIRNYLFHFWMFLYQAVQKVFFLVFSCFVSMTVSSFLFIILYTWDFFSLFLLIRLASDLPLLWYFLKN